MILHDEIASCMQEDLRHPHSLVQNFVWTCINKIVEPALNCWPFNKLRDVALKNVMKHVHYSDESTKYMGICPISKVIKQCVHILYFVGKILCY
jgi:achilleol B synthase